MAWSEHEIMCKKHPDQRQQPGVCSSCLREKLAKLPTFTFTMVPSRFSSSSSLSSSSSPTCIIMSPTKNKNHGNYQRNSSALITGSDFGIINGRNYGLMRKSRSITYVGRRKGRINGGGGGGGGGGCGGDGKKKKEGFWTKLLRSTSMKTKGVFIHSKERS